MNKNLKTGLVLLTVASVLFLCCAVAFFVLKEAEKEKRLSLEGELEETLKAKESLTKDLNELEIAKGELESKLNLAKKQEKKLSEELAELDEAKKKIASQLEEERKKSSDLMANVMKERDERLNLMDKLSETDEAYSKLKERYELMAEVKETLEVKLKKVMAEKGIELKRIEVESEYQKEENPKSKKSSWFKWSSKRKSIIQDEANVLVVNRRFDFIVTNIGKTDGATIGTGLDVYRGDKFIAKTRIEKLYDEMSAATILPKWKKSTVREGDQVYLSQ